MTTMSPKRLTELGTLIEIDVRTAWTHEAQHFTPWLAAHLEQLSAKIGIPLELEGVEVPVDSFSADILARNPLDNSRVLIENQLERTDHNHLGQILTYLAGLDVRTVIWIAPEFRDAHLSALKWLNEHSAAPFSFFAVRVKVVRINDSLPAPVFEVVERPNEWDRRIQEMAPSAMGEYGLLRRDFWTDYIAKYPEEAEFGQPSGATSRWHIFRDYNLVLTIFLSKDYAGLLIRGMHGADPKSTAEILTAHRQQLEILTGSSECDEKSGYFFILRQKGDTTNPATRESIYIWLHDAINRYSNALHECFGAKN